jgi:phosphohistidine phosphatase
MRLYLVQHGKAMSKADNADRPLTDEGRRDVDAVMLLMMRFGAITATRVFHSGKLRAAQTAQRIASRIDVPMEEVDGLAPMDDPRIWQELLAGGTEDVMLVGHLPHLERLASLLLCGDPEGDTVRFFNGGIVCLEGEERGWTLRWAISPSLVR